MDAHHNAVALKTILRKETTRFFRIWTQTLLPSVITQTLYFLIFGKFIGSRIGTIEGLPYMAFIVPGLVMMSVINNSYTNVVSSFFSSKFQRNVEELMVSSTPNWVILSGYVFGGILRGMIVGVLVFGVSVFFTHPHIHNMALIIVFVILTSMMFSLGGFLNAIFAKKFDDISIFPTFVLTPLIYLGGVFYSVKNLPPIWQGISKLNPILYMVNGFRYGFYGVSDVNVWGSIVILMIFTGILASVNLYHLHRGTGLKT